MIRIIAAAAAVCLLSTPIAAAPVGFSASTFSDLASFEAAAGPLDYDSFEDRVGSFVNNLDLTRGTYSCSGGSPSLPCPNWFGAVNLTGNRSPANPDLTAHDGDVALGFLAGQTATFTFDTVVTAFGIFIGGAGNLLAGPSLIQSPVTMNASVNGESYSILSDYENLGTTFPGNTIFFGIVDPLGFTTVSFTAASAGDDFIQFDSMYLTAAAVPLPAGLPLLAAALGLGGLLGRRRR